MHKNLKTALIFLLGVTITVGLILVPWDTLIDRIGFDPFRTNVPASMKVNCFVGKCNVYLDGQKKSATPMEILRVTPGEHTIKLERISSEQDFYTTITKKVNFLKGTEVYMEWEVGPSEVFSQGHVLSFKQRNHTTEPVLSIDSNQNDVDVSIDGVNVGTVPFLGDSELLKEGTHKVTLSKQGYIDREMEVKINYNYIANLEVDLMAEPIITDK
jgi:hypothetical protein